MKKPWLLPLLLVMLAGCGADPAPTATPEGTSPPAVSGTAAPAPSAPVDADDGDAWVAHIDLTALPQKGELPVELADGTRVACLAKADSADVSLYAVQRPDTEGRDLLFRYVDKLQAMGTLAEGEQVTAAVWSDWDGDGDSELAVVLRGEATSGLTVYEWDGGWTARAFEPEAYSRQLLDVLDYTYGNRTLTVTHGRESASLTLGPTETGRIGFHEDFGGLAAFRVEDGALYAVFGLGADVNGEVRYFGTLTATVTYDGEGFSLYDLRLISNSGV